jgi:hypothetical protein
MAISIVKHQLKPAEVLATQYTKEADAAEIAAWIGSDATVQSEPTSDPKVTAKVIVIDYPDSGTRYVARVGDWIIDEAPNRPDAPEKHRAVTNEEFTRDWTKTFA